MKQKIENDNSIYVAKTKFDDVFCERAIGLYEMREKHAKAEIIQSTNAFHDGTHQDTISRKDRATYIDDYDTHRDLGDLDLTNAINLALNSSMAEYIELFPTLKACSIRSTRQKIQKTLPKEGYHVWHFENGSLDTSDRVVAWTIYLNDVEEGGETEFLYQSKRVKAKKGDICIFPANFLYPHRGNPPLSGTKYIITGWFNLF